MVHRIIVCTVGRGKKGEVVAGGCRTFDSPNALMAKPTVPSGIASALTASRARSSWTSGSLNSRPTKCLKYEIVFLKLVIFFWRPPSPSSRCFSPYDTTELHTLKKKGNPGIRQPRPVRNSTLTNPCLDWDCPERHHCAASIEERTPVERHTPDAGALLHSRTKWTTWSSAKRWRRECSQTQEPRGRECLRGLTLAVPIEQHFNASTPR